MTGVFRPVTEVTISAAFTFGMVLALLGSLKLTLSRSLNLGEGRVGALLSVLNLAMIPMMFLSGLSIDVYGAQPVLILSSVMTAIALFALSSRLSVSRAFIAVLLCGLGSAGLCTSSIVLMPDAFFPGEPSASLNVGIVFFALGALVTPVLIDVLIRLLDYRRALAFLALMCLVPAILAALWAPEDVRLGEPETAELTAVLSLRSLWLAGLVLALYSPLEASISFWATTYLTDRGHGERRATWLLSSFWGSFLLSRLLVAVLMHDRFIRPTWGAWVLVVSALLAAVVLGNMAGTAGTDKARRGLLLLGLCLGPIFPTLIGMAFEGMSKAHEGYGTAFGMLFAAGSLGSLVLAPLFCLTSQRRNAQTALRMPMLGALLLTAVALVFGLAS